MRKTLKAILAEYGRVALAVYLSIFAVVLLSAWAAIRLGWQPQGVGANMGAFTAAYLATKVTQPVRIAATIAMTPFIARGVARFQRRRSPT